MTATCPGCRAYMTDGRVRHGDMAVFRCFQCGLLSIQPDVRPTDPRYEHLNRSI